MKSAWQSDLSAISRPGGGTIKSVAEQPALRGSQSEAGCSLAVHGEEQWEVRFDLAFAFGRDVDDFAACDDLSDCVMLKEAGEIHIIGGTIRVVRDRISRVPGCGG